MPRAEKLAFSGSAFSNPTGVNVGDLAVSRVFRAQLISLACALTASDERRTP